MSGGYRSLGIGVEVDRVMESCEDDDRAMERLLRLVEVEAPWGWVELRYRETWALLLRHEGAVVAVARHALQGDWEEAQALLGRLSADAAATASGWLVAHRPRSGCDGGVRYGVRFLAGLA